MDHLQYPLVSVFTCVYNRADTIDRVFRSIKNQTYPNIEHVIVNDGSTDNVMELIRQYKDEVDYTVKVFDKPNGGKHTATNIAWSLAEGKYIVQLDSDDELLPFAIEKLVGLWDEIPKEERDNYWCVQGRCRNQFSDKMVGEFYPDNINYLPVEEKKIAASKVSGDKLGLMRSDIIKNYKYPEPSGVKFVSERVLWWELNKKYSTWYSNNIVLVYYVDEGECLSKPKMTVQTATNRCWDAKWCIENAHNYKQIDLTKNIIKYVRYWHHANEQYKRGNSFLNIDASVSVKFLILLLWFPMKFVKLSIEG